METIAVQVNKKGVYEEVAKATDYTGSKLLDGDEHARDRILATDEDLAEIGRFWDEAMLVVNERLKAMLVSGVSVGDSYKATLEVSKAFDKELTGSVESSLQNFFITSIIGQWFRYTNKAEAEGYLKQSVDFLDAVERLLYSRKRPKVPRE